MKVEIQVHITADLEARMVEMVSRFQLVSQKGKELIEVDKELAEDLSDDEDTEDDQVLIFSFIYLSYISILTC